MSFWDTPAGRWGMAAWNMDREAHDDEPRRFADTDYCPVCNYLLSDHLIDACPTELEIRARYGDR